MRPLVMGILNVTPDSFSDGGRWLDPDAAIAHGLEMIAEGADLVDVGGESTRPGAEPVDAEEELRRVLPVVTELARHTRVSIDTTKPQVAEAALEAGASLVNDVSASLWEVAAAGDAGWVAMHRAGDPATMQIAPHYDDVVTEVRDFVVAAAEKAVDAGVSEVWIDPGIGFGKNVQHNLSLLAHLDVLVATGFPVMIGTSRKSTLGRLLAASDHLVKAPPLTGFEAGTVAAEAARLDPVPPDDRIEGSIATLVWALTQGVRMVRVHDVRASVQATKLVAA